MHELYVLEKNGINEVVNDKKWDVRRIRLTPKLFGTLNSLYWNVITMGKARVYVVVADSRIIHSSYVIPKCYKFPFLRKKKYNDIEIGPCQTRKQDRGKGIYPYVLNEIVRCELKEGDRAYMIVHETNAASQRGVQKAGFVKVGKVERDWLKRYIVCDMQSE